MESAKVYAEGETKEECYKQLQKDFPEAKPYRGHRAGGRIYPETLQIMRLRKVGGDSGVVVGYYGSD